MTQIDRLGRVTYMLVSLGLGGCVARATEPEAKSPSSTTPDVALREAASAACADIPVEERQAGIFAHPERITAVEHVRRAAWAKGPVQLVGAAISVRATPGVTEQWLGRVLVCNQAYRTAFPEVSNVYAGSTRAFDRARFSVSSDRLGFRIEISAPDRDRALAVFESALALSRL